MQKVMCEHCKQEVPVMLYFYDAEITTNRGSLNFDRYYEAQCKGKSICPYCGTEVHKTFKKLISVEDIIDLAGGRGQD
jgi:hypothetical protein